MNSPADSQLSGADTELISEPVPDSEADLLLSLNNVFASLGAWSYDKRWWVILASMLVVFSSLFWASKAHVNMTFDSFFEEKDPTYAAYLQYRSDFGSDEVSYILYEVPNKVHGNFNLDVMQRIARLTKALEEEVPFVARVLSLTNAEITRSIDNNIDIFKLEDDFPQTQQQLLVFRDQVLAEPMLEGGIVNKDASYAAIVVEMEKSSIDSPQDLKLDPQGGDWIDNLYPQVSNAAIEKILARPEYAGIKFYHAGDVRFNAEYNNILVPQTIATTLATYTIIGLLLFVFFRRLRSVIGPFVVVSISIIVSVAIVGIFSWDLDLLFPFVPNLLVAIGVADSVHIISEFNIHFRKLGDRREAIRQTMYLVGTPCMLTSLTTAASLMALSFSNVKSVAHMALYSAAGILTAFVLSVTLLMIFYAFGSNKEVPSLVKSADGVDNGHGDSQSNNQNFWLDKTLSAIASFTVKHARFVVGVSALIMLIAFYGLSQLRVDTDFLTEWAEDAPVRVMTKKVDKEMGGMAPIVYLFDTGQVDGITDPRVLREIETVQRIADAQNQVKKSYSIVNVIKDLNQTFHNDDPQYYRIPEDRQLIAQLLLMYEVSGGEDLERFVASDLSKASLELRCRLQAFSHMAALEKIIAEHLHGSPLQFSSVELTGIGALWIRFADYISQSQIEGISLAFVVIAVLMCVIFRSIKVGMLSMIPNLFPVLMTMGYMGWVDIELDYSRLLLAPLAIGIAVDDTIHLVTRYHVEFKRLGNYADALHASVGSVGRALVGTTVILVMGFLANLFHGMHIQVLFGTLVAATIFTALLADLFLMPALILLIKPFGPPVDCQNHH